MEKVYGRGLWSSKTSSSKLKTPKYWVLLVLVIVIAGHCFAVKSDKPADPKKKTHIVYHPNYMDAHRDFTLYFIKSGSKTPQQMAEAVMHTRSPRLLAAMATIETDGNHTVRNAGYKKRHHGAWQVNPKYWGKVSHDPIEQAKQAEKILEDLVAPSKTIETVLSNYGGDSTDKYSKKVLAELHNTPNIGELYE